MYTGFQQLEPIRGMSCGGSAVISQANLRLLIRNQSVPIYDRGKRAVLAREVHPWFGQQGREACKVPLLKEGQQAGITVARYEPRLPCSGDSHAIQTVLRT